MTRIKTKRTSARGLVLVLIFCSSCSELPQPQVEFPKILPTSILIRNTSVLDVESGAVSSGHDVLIEDGLIAAIEPHGELSGDTVIEGRGATLVPGLIDMHGHVTAGSEASWNRGFPNVEANLRAYAYTGVTTVFDPADASGDAFSRREQVENRDLLGPRIFTTGPLLTHPDGHPIAMVRELAPWWIAWYMAGAVAVAIPDESSANQAVDKIAGQGADAIKVAVDRIPLEAPRLQGGIVSAVVERAKSHGLRVVAHIGTTRDAIDTAEAGVALWVHGVYKERIPDDQIKKLAEYEIPMVATIEVFDRYARGRQGPIIPSKMERETVHYSILESFWPIPEDFDIGQLEGWLDLAGETMDTRLDNVRRLHAAGVTILAGSDSQSGVFPGAGLHRELAQLVRAGLTPAEAIRAATLEPARWLTGDAEPNFGHIGVGMRADLLLVEGDPSADVGALEQIREVFLAGVPLEREPISGAR